jgi:ABC-type transport system involved in Fe-S cluster assembly fused permease/ATPase subunit
MRSMKLNLFIFLMTCMRNVHFNFQANKFEERVSGKAIDALLNYETVVQVRILDLDCSICTLLS